MLSFRYYITRYIKPNNKICFINLRYLYGVHHDPGVFYVKLPNYGTENGIYRFNSNFHKILTKKIEKNEINYTNNCINIILKERAVLLYKQTGKVLDMYAVKVPKKHEGKGLGRLLAEAAFTHVIVRNYRMYLTCTYLQRYYETIKTKHLSIYVLGPENILQGKYPVSMFPNTEADKLEGMPDPTDMDNKFNKD